MLLPNVTRRMSHVTRHTSHVARHTSHVTRHTSHVTRHTSPATDEALRLREALRMQGEEDVTKVLVLQSRVTLHCAASAHARV